MNTDAAAQQALQAAVGKGLLPADAVLPAPDKRPWPVVLLTALGAWLAAIPLLGVVGLLLGDVISRSAGAYFAGVLLLAAAVTMLRSRSLPVFVEQLAIPALLVGGGSLGFGLFRDLQDQGAAGLLAAVALALAFAIPRPWLRSLLGATSALLCVTALRPDGLFGHGPSSLATAWLALHLSLLAWAAIMLAQHRCSPAVAALIESTGAGWLLALLAGLCLWSGMTFLMGGTFGPGWSEAAAVLRGSPESDMLLQRSTSVSLALVAAVIGARRWPSLRSRSIAPVALVVAALAWFMPALGGVLLALAWTGTSTRWLQAGAAALAAAWIVGGFYYELAWPLGQKAVVLVVAGVMLAAFAWAARRRDMRAPAAMRTPTWNAAQALIALAAVGTLATANLSIWQKESLIANGEKMFVALAPVDPRSLMQGDFMRLNFALPDVGPGQLISSPRPQVIVRRDARGIAQLLRTATPQELPGAGEMQIELTPKDGRWILVSDAWFFREGDGRRWEAARFAEFRVLPDGRALLVGLADANLQAIPVRP